MTHMIVIVKNDKFCYVFHKVHNFSFYDLNNLYDITYMLSMISKNFMKIGSVVNFLKAFKVFDIG